MWFGVPDVVHFRSRIVSTDFVLGQKLIQAELNPNIMGRKHEPQGRCIFGLHVKLHVKQQCVFECLRKGRCTDQRESFVLALSQTQLFVG